MDLGAVWNAIQDLAARVTNLEGVPVSTSGFTRSGLTWIYVSASSLKVVGIDVTAQFPVGTKLRCKQGGVYLYYYVVSTAFSSDTTVTICGGTGLANATITDNYYSYQDNPQGFTQWFPWTVSYTGFSANPAHVAWFCVNGRKMSVFLDHAALGTSNATTKTFTMPIAAAISFANVMGLAYDNGADQALPCYLSGTAGSNIVTVKLTLTGANWTASGNCTFKAQFFVII